MIASFDQRKKPSGGEIDKSYLYDKIDMIRDDTTTALQNTVQQGYHEALRQTSSYLVEIKVESSKFDKMVNEHDLMNIPEVSKARESFKSFMKTVQAKMTLLDQYNQITLQSAQLKQQEAKFTNMANVLQQRLADSNM